MAKIVFLTVVWSVIILGIIKIAHLSKDYISWKEYVKIIVHGKTGYVVHQYWFLKTLIMIYLFFPLLKYTYDKDRVSLFIFLLIAFFLIFGNNLLNMIHQVFLIANGKLVLSEIKNYIPWYNYFYQVPNAYALVYFITGGFIYSFFKDNRRSIPYTLLLVLFVLFWTLSIAVTLIFESKIKWDPCFDGYGSVTTLMMSCCMCLLILRLRPLKLNHYVQLVAKNTLGIYLIHGIIIYATKPIISENPQLANLFCQLIYSSIILVFSLMIVLSLKRIPYVRALVRI